MKFIDYRSLYGHYAFLFQHDKHDTDVVFVTRNNIHLDSFLMQFFGRLYHSHIKFLPPVLYRRIWYKFLVPIGTDTGNDKLCFIIPSFVIVNFGARFVDYVRSKYNCKVAIVFSDRVESYPKGLEIDSLRNVVDLICTYNPVDAEKYKISLHPGMLCNLFVPNEKPFSERTIDVFFIGQEKGRGEEILNIYRKCNEYGLKCEFIIVGETTIPKQDGIVYCDWVPYEDMFEKLKNSKSIVNILQPGASGVTLRDIEAYNLGCFLITTNSNSDLNEIMNEGQIVNFAAFNQGMANIIKGRKERFPRRKNNYSLDNFYNWIEESCNE